MSQLAKRRVVLAKIETTYGTDSTPTGAANAILCKNLDVTPLDAEIVSRDVIRSYLGASDQIIAAYSVKISFEVELQGSGAAGTAPAYGPLLRACAMSETLVASTTATYKPISSAMESCTIWCQPGDNVSATSPMHKIVGCRGTVSFSLNAKQIPVAKFSMTGLYVAVTDITNLVGTYTGFKTPAAVSKANTPTFTFLGHTAIMSEFSLDLGNEVTYRNLVNSESVIITDRKAGGSVTFDSPLIATKNFFSEALGATLGNMSLIHGATAGYIVEFAATATVDIINPSYAEADGIVMMVAPFVLVPTTAGNDEFSLIIR
jgi:hypothetical protein